MLEEINLIDLKKLNYEQLDSLAKEIREEIITVVSKNGGHLASNLGIVELTIALHKQTTTSNNILTIYISLFLMFLINPILTKF